jgi:hypothetical protein
MHRSWHMHANPVLPQHATQTPTGRCGLHACRRLQSNPFSLISGLYRHGGHFTAYAALCCRCTALCGEYTTLLCRRRLRSGSAFQMAADGRAFRLGSQLRVHAFVKQQQDNSALNDGIAKFYDESSGLWEDM